MMTYDINELYKKYGAELFELSTALRPVFYRMLGDKQDATYGDVEGEILYMLVRETKPEIVFEISPNAGWSTNYMLSALTKNAKGTMHSFEIMTHYNGKPIEQVIRGNQCALCDQSRYQLHIGDAREETKKIAGNIDFILIDSDHGRAFAEWYTKEIIPRVQGTIVIQDIAFRDVWEKSTEAAYIKEWLDREQIAVTFAGDWERTARFSGVRDYLPERRGLRTNSIIFQFPAEKSAPSQVAEGPDAFIAAAKAALEKGDRTVATGSVNKASARLVSEPTRVNRQRQFMQVAKLYRQLGEHSEAKRAAQRAFACTVAADGQQRGKSMSEVFLLLVRQGYYHLALQTFLIVLVTPKLWKRFLITISRFIRKSPNSL